VTARAPEVLVLRALGLGDLLTALPALRALRRHWPSGRLTLATQGWLAPLAAWLDVADEIVAVAPLVPLPPGVRADVAVNLHGSGPQSHGVLRALPGPPRLIAFACAEAGVSGPAWREDEHERDRWCRLLTASC